MDQYDVDRRPPMEIQAHNRRRVYDWFVAHPCHSNRDCAAALGLGEVAVGRHARAIRDGWRPDDGDQT